MPATATEAARPEAPGARRARLVGVLVLAAAAGTAAWWSMRTAGASREPAGVFDYVRDGVLAGDGGAAWRVLGAKARLDYEKFARAMAAGGNDPAGAEWRRRVGLSRQDLATLPPERILERDFTAYAEEKFRGARVYRTDTWDSETALIYIALRDGSEAHWQVRRVDGIWKVESLPPLVDTGGNLMVGPGEPRRRVPVPDKTVAPRDR